MTNADYTGVAFAVTGMSLQFTSKSLRPKPSTSTSTATVLLVVLGGAHKRPAHTNPELETQIV
jgi:hypothetical protein